LAAAWVDGEWDRLKEEKLSAEQHKADLEALFKAVLTEVWPIWSQRDMLWKP